MKLTIIMSAVLAGVVTLAAAPARAQETGGSPISPQAATVYRTGMGGSMFGGSPGGSARHELLKAGAITLGAGYLGSAVGAMVALSTIDYSVTRNDFTEQYDGFGAKQATEKLYIPVFGPWMALSENLTAMERCHLEGLACSDEEYWAGNVGFIIAGAAQAAGVGLIIFGLMQAPSSDGAPPTNRVILSAGAIPGGGLFVVAGGF